MIDKRLVGLISGSMKYVVGNVICQWCSLLANIAMMTAITRLLAGLFVGSMGQTDLFLTAAVALAAVQTWAKKLLGKYWGQYTELGDIFLENLQGLTTLKIYQVDEFKQEEMNDAPARFLFSCGYEWNGCK